MAELRYRARWVTAEEKYIHNEHNGVVEDLLGQFGPKKLFFVSPMNLAIRVAASLNITARFTTDELERMAGALSQKEKPHGEI